MKLEAQKIVNHIHELIQTGSFKEAYNYVTEVDCIEEECRQQLSCFRYLLGCINGETPQENEFSFTNKPKTTPSGMDRLKYQMDIKCQGRIYDELRKLCRKII